MGWGETLRLTRILRADPSSMLAAALEGWDHPVPRTDAILMDLWDLTYKAAGAKRPEPYPRPWKQVHTERRGNAAGRTPDEVKAILRTQFGQPEAPV